MLSGLRRWRSRRCSPDAAERVAEQGFPVSWDADFPGYRRFYTADGNGNRVEILAEG